MDEVPVELVGHNRNHVMWRVAMGAGYKILTYPASVMEGCVWDRKVCSVHPKGSELVVTVSDGSVVSGAGHQFVGDIVDVEVVSG